MFADFLPSHLWSDLTVVALLGLVVCVILALGYKLIDRIWTKVDLEAEIAKGNVSAGIASAGIVLGLCYVLAQVAKAVIAG